MYLLLASASAAVPTTETAANTATQTKRGVAGVIQAWGDLQNYEQELVARQVDINFERTLAFPSLTEMERIDGLLNAKYSELDALQEEKGEDYEGVYVLEEQIEDLKQTRNEFETTYDARRARQQENIRELSDRIADLEENIEKQRFFLHAQVRNALISIGFVLALIALLFLIRFALGRIIERMPIHSQERKKALHRLSRGVLNILLLTVGLGLLFSQVLSLLPFIAIFGTGLAFAIRDIISSFIGWFVIGTDRGYRVGDILQVGDNTGRVSEIGPLLTLMQEYKHGSRTGRVMSFPNKLVFEGQVINASRTRNQISESVTFLLSVESDFDLARTLLRQAYETAQKQGQDTQDTKNESTLPEPNIFLENELHGVKITLVFWADIFQIPNMVSLITQDFVSCVHKHKKVELCYVEAKPHTHKAHGKTHAENPHDHPH